MQDAITRLTTEGINIGHITFDKVEMPYLKEATEEMQKIHEDLLKRYGDTEPSPLTGEQGIPRLAIEGKYKDAAGNEYPVGYHGHGRALTNGLPANEGSGDYKAQMTALLNDMVGGYNRADPNVNSDVRSLYEQFSVMTSGKYGQDTILDAGELARLLPYVVKIAANTEKYQGWDERRFNFYITE